RTCPSAQRTATARRVPSGERARTVPGPAAAVISGPNSTLSRTSGCSTDSVARHQTAPPPAARPITSTAQYRDHLGLFATSLGASAAVWGWPEVRYISLRAG